MRLIDADALLKELSDLEAHGGHPTYRKALSDALNDFFPQIIAAQTTITAAESTPQQHGAWQWNPNGMDWGLGAWQCSICGCKNDNLPCDTRISPRTFAGSRFCPNCGAKMDAEVKAT